MLAELVRLPRFPVIIDSEAHNKRGTCPNALSVREAVVRASLFDEMRHRLISERGIAHARKIIAERLRDLSRHQGSQMRESRLRLDKLEAKIAKLVEFVADGHGTKAVSEELKKLEREGDAERRTLAALEKHSTAPIELPSPEEMVKLVLDFETLLNADVTRGREALRRFFRDGRIDMVPQPDGFYVARSQILPLVLLTRTPSEESPGGRYTAVSCAGRIRTLEHDPTVRARGVFLMTAHPSRGVCAASLRGTSLL